MLRSRTVILVIVTKLCIAKPSASQKVVPDRFSAIGSVRHFLFALSPVARIADRTRAVEQCGRSVRVLAPETRQLRDGARAAPDRHGGRQGRGRDERESRRKPADLEHTEGVSAGPAAVPDGVRDGRQARQAFDGFDLGWHRRTSLPLCTYGRRRGKRGESRTAEETGRFKGDGGGR